MSNEQKSITISETPQIQNIILPAGIIWIRIVCIPFQPAVCSIWVHCANTPFKTIQAKIIQVNDLQARCISATENLQREDFSAIESIEAIVEIIDAHLIEDQEYATMGQTPENRLAEFSGCFCP